jgi:hypothetical protein
LIAILVILAAILDVSIYTQCFCELVNVSNAFLDIIIQVIDTKKKDIAQNMSKNVYPAIHLAAMLAAILNARQYRIVF